MTKLKNIILATEENIGYYSILKKSCKKNNIDLIILGLGKNWEGFTMKFYEYYNYLQNINSNEIVMINDAYDVIILENSEIIINRFEKMNIPILFGNHSGITEFLSKGSWNNNICTGNIIGYAGYLKNMFKTIIEYKHLWEKFNNDDQTIINYLYKKNILKDIHLDTDNKVFFIVSDDNRYFNLSYLTQGKISGLEMKNGKIYNNHTVCVFHLPGNMNGNLYLNYIGYDTSNVKLKIKGYRFTQIYGLLKHYFIIIIILILMYIIYRLRK